MNYRATFQTTAQAGDAVVIPGNATKIVRVLEVFIAKPSAQITVTLSKRSTATTGGTAANLTPVPIDSLSPATALTTPRSYSGAAPTQGTAIGNVGIDVVPSGDRTTFRFGVPNNDDRDERYLTLRSAAETLAVVIDVAATIQGHVEWSERNS